MEINYNLNIFYKSYQDKKLAKDMKAIDGKIEAFTKKYSPLFSSTAISSSKVLSYIEELESIKSAIMIPYTFARLKQDTGDLANESQKKYQMIMNWFQKSETKLSKINVKFSKHPQLAEWSKDKKLANYKYFLEKKFEFSKYFLTEDQEDILNITEYARETSWNELYNTIKSKATLKYKNKEYSIQELLSKRFSKDRKVRKETTEILSKYFQDNSHIYGHILRTKIMNRNTQKEARGYKLAYEPEIIGRGINTETLKGLIASVHKSLPILREWYNLKRKVLGFDKFYEYDRLVNLKEGKEKNTTWKEAKEIVLSSYYDFMPEFGKIAEDFFKEKRIDATVRKGKRGGAYCMYSSPKLPVFIHVNFEGKISEVATLAHELGHGIHGILSRTQSMFNYHPSLALAETASIFGEELLKSRLYKNSKTNNEKIMLLGKNLDEVANTIHRQVLFFEFEIKITEHYEKNKSLTDDEIILIWKNLNQQYYKNSMEFIDGQFSFWAAIHHFYDYDFYTINYAFGSLLTFSLYELYQETKDKEDFKKKYKEFLAAGNSTGPDILIKKYFGLDINNEDFWDKGMQELSRKLKELKKLVKS